MVGCRTSCIDLIDESRRCPRQRRVGAHAAGVGPGVAVAQPLEVLGRLERDHRETVGDGEDRHLGAVEELLDDDSGALLGVRQRLLSVGRHDDALAGGEPVLLDDVRRPERVQRFLDLRRAGADVRPRSRHARRGHDVLGERLAALELRRGLRGSEAGDPALPNGVGDTGDQRGFGADDDQIDAEPLRQVGNGLRVHGVHPVQGGESCHPGVAGCGVQLGHLRVLAQRQEQRVLAGARAEDEHVHSSPP